MINALCLCKPNQSHIEKKKKRFPNRNHNRTMSDNKNDIHHHRHRDLTDDAMNVATAYCR